MGIRMKPYSVIDCAKRNGITNFLHDQEHMKIRFIAYKMGHETIIDVWYTKMTVGTTIDHPTKGRNTLFRKNVSIGLLNLIFKNPRLHTRKGYRTRERKKIIW